MKAVILHEYGGAEKLKLEEWPDPIAGEDEVLVHVAAVSINPIDYKMRSGELKQMFPVELPAILGRDLSGVVRAVGAGITGFEPGDKVFALARQTYAELCVVKASELARIPDGLDMVKASALPLVTLTGEQLIRVGTKIEAGQTVLVAGAIGGVGRAAIRTAKDAGARVLAGVRKKQVDEAKSLDADQVIALDDAEAMSGLGFIDAVADAVGGATAEMLMGKVKQGGVFASVLGPPSNAAMHPTVRVEAVMAKPDPEGLVRLASAVIAGKWEVPIDRVLPLAEAGEGQTAAEKGGIGKVILVC